MEEGANDEEGGPEQLRDRVMHPLVMSVSPGILFARAAAVAFQQAFCLQALFNLERFQPRGSAMTNRLVCFTVTLVWAASAARAQQTDALQQQLQQLKQQYADTTRLLEQRIAALE